jgi:hypothetical protein
MEVMNLEKNSECSVLHEAYEAVHSVISQNERMEPTSVLLHCFAGSKQERRGQFVRLTTVPFGLVYSFHVSRRSDRSQG